MIDYLASWVSDGIIDRYIITPDPDPDRLKLHLFMRREVKILRSYDFDLWFTRSEMQVIDQYIKRCVLQEDCITIVYWPFSTFLLVIHPAIVRNLFSGSIMEKYLPEIDLSSENSLQPKENNKIVNMGKRFGHMLGKIIKERSFRKVLKKINIKFYYVIKAKYKMIKVKYRHLKRSYIKPYLIDRNLLPLLMVGKRFKLGPYDLITQMGSGLADAYIFCDKIEVEAHKFLFKKSNVFLAKYPTKERCQCDSSRKKKGAILCPLSTGSGADQIPLLSRDLQTVLTETGAVSVHLRIHPAFGGLDGLDWPSQLQVNLKKNDIDAEVVGCEVPIGDVACNYICVAAPVTSSLRHVRAACKEVIVVCFSATSKSYLSEPKLAFGSAEGIGWINEDGSFDPVIFKPHRYHPEAKKNVTDIVFELSKKTL
tara:strand:+ start:1161 stop:2432 length:1272 start_codon:yes stop_codon:yes gene_type:complete